MNLENTNIFKNTAPNQEAISGGVWVTPTDKMGRPYGMKFLVKPITSPAYLASLEIVRSQHSEDIMVLENSDEFKKRSKEEQERLIRLKSEITAEAVARSIILDWKGLEDEKGSIDYSVENCKDLLSHPSMSELADGVIRCCLDRMNFTESARLKGLESLKKN